MSLFEELERRFRGIADECPAAGLRVRPLTGSRDASDDLIIERRIGREERVIRISARSEGIMGFYWGQLPLPGEDMEPHHSEGHRYGSIDFVMHFARLFLVELWEWRELPEFESNWSASPEGTPRDGS